MEPTNLEAKELSKEDIQAIRAMGISFLIVVQIAMLVVLNVYDYSYIFPSRSGLTMGHQLLFCAIYVVALVWGSVV